MKCHDEFPGVMSGVYASLASEQPDELGSQRPTIWANDALSPTATESRPNAAFRGQASAR